MATQIHVRRLFGRSGGWIDRWCHRYTMTSAVLLVYYLTIYLVDVSVIPQALAYATVAGLPPQVKTKFLQILFSNWQDYIQRKYGLYSSFIGCFLYVILGSAHAITIGPTALLALLTSDGATSMGPGAAVLLAFLKGCIEMTLGLLNFGMITSLKDWNV